MASPTLIALGYWRSLYEPQLPDPACFVDNTWSAAEPQRVIAYLRQGRSLISFMGFSWCRFRCGAGYSEMGTADMTDGTYIWPEGLGHYIENHQLRLPVEAVHHILAQAEFPTEQAASVPAFSERNYDWWLTQKGWQPHSSSFLSASDEEECAYLRRYERGQIDFSDHSSTAHQAREQLVQSLREKFNSSN